MTNSHNKQDKATNQAEATPAENEQPPAAEKDSSTASAAENRQTEHGGAKGLEPTRYGDWERNGRCTDF